MAAILGTNSSNRLVEMLAGSAALMSDLADAASGVASPVSLSSLFGDDADGTTDAQPASGVLNTLDPAAGNILDVSGGTDQDASVLQLAGADAPLQPLFNVENAAVLDFHYDIEALSDETGAIDVVHSLTNAGETIGLGRVGTTPATADGNTNLVTDTVNVAGTTMANGPLDAVSNLGADLTGSVNAGNGLVHSVLFGGDPLNPVPELIGTVAGATQNPASAIGEIADDVLNGGALNSGGLGLPILTDAGMLTNGGLLNTPVLNGIGTQNITGAPMADLLTVNGGNNAGDGGAIGAVIGDLNGSSAGHHLIDADAGPQENGSSVDVLSVPTGADHTADLNVIDVGPNTPQLANIGAANDLNQAGVPVLGDTGILSGAGTGTGDLLNTDGAALATINGGNNANDGGAIGGIVGDLNGSSSGHHLIDADAGPQQNGSSVDVLSVPTGADHTADLNVIDVGPNTPQLADIGAANDLNQAGVPVLGDTGILSGAGTGNLLNTGNGGLLNTDGAALATINGGNNANDGGAIGGIVGDLNGSSAGHHLVDADAGPQENGSSVDVLSVPTGADHSADINAVDVGPNSPQLADLGVLNNPDMINIPTLNGAGTDALTGIIPENTVGTPVAGPEPAVAPAPVDAGHTAEILPVSLTGDHGILDLNGSHII